ncbi:MAG: hypothetical protein DMF75_04395 [Acidobacteria bacterium]|nr:MAG: hypothetical protein DMF75_04395 [Acidobacteriota bacterium]
MEIKNLLKSQGNQVFEAIRRNEWEPSEFEWQETQGPGSGTQVFQLVHKASGFYFVFDNVGGNFYSKWSPAEQTLEQIQGLANWPTQLVHFNNWLLYLRRETESPDLWRAISKEAQVLESAASADTSNAPFTAEEKAYIVQGINEIKQYLLTAHKLDPELVESRLKYLIESSERVGRKDWINLLISVLVGIVISAALPPEATRELFRFVGTVLRQIINQPLLLM